MTSYSIVASEASPFRKSNGSVQYWCSPCNRRLASKIVYERHLKSDLHLKRAECDRDFDESVRIRKDMSVVSDWAQYSGQKDKGVQDVKQKSRRKTFIRCEVCRSRVHVLQVGKHLISHYHCRRGDINSFGARQMILDNIYSIVLHSPYQCSNCRFFSNTHQDFLKHWMSPEHVATVSRFLGYYWCSFCKYEVSGNDEMYSHLTSDGHGEIISVINRSVPIVIKKISLIECQVCKERFSLNIQLKKHCERENHPLDRASSNSGAYVHRCDMCGEVFKSKVALQRHQKRQHQKFFYICSACNLNFDTQLEAIRHRKTTAHRSTTKRKSSDASDAQTKTGKTCIYCTSTFDDFTQMKQHLTEFHPEHGHR